MNGGAYGLAKWHEYMDSHGDLTLLGAMVADDAVFHSPVVHTPQVGCDRARAPVASLPARQ